MKRNKVWTVTLNGNILPQVFATRDLIYRSIQITYSALDHQIEEIKDGWRVHVEPTKTPEGYTTKPTADVFITNEVVVLDKADHF